jgi:hypothetical protein
MIEDNQLLLIQLTFAVVDVVLKIEMDMIGGCLFSITPNDGQYETVAL